MSASCTSFDLHTNTGCFCISSASEVEKLPTTKKGGSGELKYVNPVNAGSNCIVLSTNSILILDGETNLWKTYSPGGGGGGGGGGGDGSVQPKPTSDDFPETGEKGIIYIDTSENKLYLWDENDSEYKCVGLTFENVIFDGSF